MTTLFTFMTSVINTLRASGRARTAEAYQSALNSFAKHRANTDIPLHQITQHTMDAYQNWLLQRGIIPNTVSFYARILRAVYNRAIDLNLTQDRKPFRHIYTGIAKTTKRALPLDTIRRLRTLDLTHNPAADYARDIYILAFYLRGISFIDLALLRKTNLRNGILTYRRRKTGRTLTIAWTPEMQTILDKYPHNPTPYLLPVITRHDDDPRKTIRNRAYAINYNLKKIAHLLGITAPLTLYTARHTWATAARTLGIPIPTISQALGHDSETTTRIYLADLDTTPVDSANALIISSI